MIHPLLKSKRAIFGQHGKEIAPESEGLSVLKENVVPSCPIDLEAIRSFIARSVPQAGGLRVLMCPPRTILYTISVRSLGYLYAQEPTPTFHLILYLIYGRSTCFCLATLSLSRYCQNTILGRGMVMGLTVYYSLPGTY